MTLFLTSSPCEDRVPAGCTLPCVLNTENSFVDRLMSRVRPGEKCVVIAATPDAHALNDEMALTFHRALAWHGMEPSVTDMVDDRNPEEAAALCREAGLVILGGGHVPTQQAFFRSLGLREILRGYRGTVMGISAGSMNCCGCVYAQPEEPGEATDPAYRKFLPGLGLTDVMVLPHLNRVRDNLVDGLRLFEDITWKDSFGHTFLSIPDGSFVLQEGRQPVLYGEGWIVRDGRMTRIAASGDVTLL